MFDLDLRRNLFDVISEHNNYYDYYCINLVMLLLLSLLLLILLSLFLLHICNILQAGLLPPYPLDCDLRLLLIINIVWLLSLSTETCNCYYHGVTKLIINTIFNLSRIDLLRKTIRIMISTLRTIAMLFWFQRWNDTPQYFACCLFQCWNNSPQYFASSSVFFFIFCISLLCWWNTEQATQIQSQSSV